MFHVDQMIDRNYVLVQKNSNAITARDLKDRLPNLPLKTEKAKEKLTFFYQNNFVLP
jgi:hypothetical protein